MTTSKIRCPKCTASLAIPQPMPEKVTCSNCQAVLRLAPANAAAGKAPASAAPSAVKTATAKMVAGYELQRVLKRGGLGVVYLAYHPRLKHYRAIKRPQPRADLDSEILLGRFMRETEALGALENKHILRAYDAGSDAEGPYLVMEYLDGESLSDLVSRHRRLPVSEACELIRQAALGLQAAHESGLIHRDIKPSNLMLARANAGTARVTVIDWGLVKHVGEADVATNRLTAMRTELGTPDYIAPEQVRDASSVDIRADIYSLGATLYFLLAGQPPFHGRSDEQKQLAQAREEFPPLEQVRPDVPHNLINVLKKMVKKERNQRYATPGEAAAALQPFCTTEPHRLLALLAPVSSEQPLANDTARIFDEKTQMAPPPMPPAAPSQSSSRQLVVWGVAAVSAMLVLLSCGVLSVIVGAWVLKKDDKGNPDVVLAKDKTDGSSKKTGNDIEPINSAWLMPPPNGPVLEAGAPGLVKKMPGHQYICTSIVILPDGLRAVSRTLFSTNVWDLKNQRHSGTSWGTPQVGLAAVTPNGKVLGTSAYNVVSRYDGKTYKLIPAPRALESWCTGLTFSPDSKIMATAEQDGVRGRVRFWDAETGSPYGEKDLTMESPVISLAFSPDGNALLTSTANVSTHDLRSVNTGERKIALWNIKDLKKLRELDGHPDAAAGATFFADGKRIFTASPFDGTLRVWSMEGSEQTSVRVQAGPSLLKDELKKDPNDPRQITCVTFWPWGRALIGYRHGGIKLFDMNNGKKLWESESQSDQAGAIASAVAISPDGHHAVLAMSDHKVYLFRLPTP